MKTLLFIILNLLFANVMLSQPPTIEKEKALEDVEEFQQILETRSSYLQLTDFDYKSQIELLKKEIQSSVSISILYLTNEMGKIVAEIGDRHSNVRYREFDFDDYTEANLKFPFAVSTLGNDYVLLKINEEIGPPQYLYFSEDYPIIKSINGIAVHDFMGKYFYKNKKAPLTSKLNRNASDIRWIGEAFYMHGEFHHKKITITLTNGKSNKTFTFTLDERRIDWNDIGGIGKNQYKKAIEEKEYYRLDQWLKDDIGYIALPEMVDYEEHLDYEEFLIQTLEKYRNAKALIFDVKSNGGGMRHIVKTVSEYIVPPNQSPWVANVAHIRTDQPIEENSGALKGKFLYNYNSDLFSDKDRKAIDDFNQGFKTNRSFDSSKFTAPFYMVLHSGEKPLTCPIYILMNERSFSAASIFASVFKGLPNVKLVGVTTDGSSGRSRKIYLKNSNIRIKISTMISFQRNGKTLDGNGTEPDIFLPRDEKQVLGVRDTQLEKLVEMIEKKK